jgi:hypothetical protein
MRPLDMIVCVVQDAHTAVADAASVKAMISFFISVFQVKKDNLGQSHQPLLYE